MKRLISPTLWVVAAVCLFTSLCILPKDEYKFIDDAINTVVCIRSDAGCSGSGVLISDREVLTAAHVIGCGNKVTIEFYNGIVVDTNDFYISDANDIAVLILPEKITIKPIKFCDLFRIGEPIYCIGHPFGKSRKLTWSVHFGIISGLGRDYSHVGLGKAVQIDAAAYPGSSGGVIINKRGQLIGIVNYCAGGDCLILGIPSNIIQKELIELRRAYDN